MLPASSEAGQQPGDWTSPAPLDSDLSYKGLVSSSDMDILRSRFSELFICPGLVGPFGKKVDKQGLVRIPGALTGVQAAIRTLAKWEAKTQGKERDRLVWWKQKLKERGMEPIKGMDIFNGLSAQRWQEYRRYYQYIVVSTSNARYKARRRRQALEEQANEARSAARHEIATTQDLVVCKEEPVTPPLKTLSGRHKGE